MWCIWLLGTWMLLAKSFLVLQLKKISKSVLKNFHSAVWALGSNNIYIWYWTTICNPELGNTHHLLAEDLVLGEERTSKKDRQRIMEGEYLLCLFIILFVVMNDAGLVNTVIVFSSESSRGGEKKSSIRRGRAESSVRFLYLHKDIGMMTDCGPFQESCWPWRSSSSGCGECASSSGGSGLLSSLSSSTPAPSPWSTTTSQSGSLNVFVSWTQKYLLPPKNI